MSIHDRKDQLIYSLAGLQATVWIGLFSVGFWQANPPMHSRVFWIAMAFATLGMFALFLSVIACFYYAKYSENAGLHRSEAAIKRARRLERLWKVPWNWYWYAFSTGMVGNLVAAIARFTGS
jgi:heme/copper-type cytochrome/quinol oxidase subunit 2